MRAPYVSSTSLEALLDPDGPAWRQARSETLPMMGTPVGLQPAPAIVVAWTPKKIGSVDHTDVSALHNGEVLAFRIQWDDATENRDITDTTVFQDGAGILLPSVTGAPVATMGAPEMPVNAWSWRADEPDGQGHHLVAEGLGTTRMLEDGLVKARGIWKEGRWRIVIARPMQVTSPDRVAQLKPGETTGFAVAIWNGANQERAGLKAFSIDWRELQVGGLPSARS